MFFICQRNDLNFKSLKLSFNEEPILFGEFKSKKLGKELTNETKAVWNKRIKTDQDLASIHERIVNKRKRFQAKFIHDNQISPTTVASEDSVPIRFDYPNRITMDEVKMIGSYPLDYNFKNIKPNYLIGMSVPPVMTAQIAHQIYLQWFTEQSVQKYPQ